MPQEFWQVNPGCTGFVICICSQRFRSGVLSLTAAVYVASICCRSAAIITPPTTVDLEDAIVSGSICIVVDGCGFIS